MTILNTLFSSEEDAAKKADINEKQIIEIWKRYTETIPEKAKLIEQIPYAFGQRKSLIQKLHRLLATELADVHTENIEEGEIVSSIRKLEYSKKIKRVQRLADALDYAKIKYEYIHSLLIHLFATLKSEYHILKEVAETNNLRKYHKLGSKMAEELAVEKALVEKMKERNSMLYSQLL